MSLPIGNINSISPSGLGDGRRHRPQFRHSDEQVRGLAVLNLEGVRSRYDNPAEVLSEIAGAPNEK